MSCERNQPHQIIESMMVSHNIGRCINCRAYVDTNGNTVNVGDWQPECSGADYWNETFHCAYGYTAKCTDCKHGTPSHVPYDYYPE